MNRRVSATAALAGATHSGAAAAFVGRQRELAELAAALESAAAGRGGLFLIGGDAGIGKSRLADEVAELAAAAGFDVLWGRCWEAGGAPAYWPWVQSIRGCLREREAERLRVDVGPDGPVLAQLLPELRSILPDLPPPPPSDAEASRFRLFDATARFLRKAAERRPLLLVMDDLHAGDVPSLLLLRFAAGELAASRILVVGLHRHLELPSDHPVAEVLAGLGREPATRSVLLGGLGQRDVARFVAVTEGLDPDPALVTAIHRQSEGNPLFMGEIVRLLAHEGRLDALTEDAALGLQLPPGVRQVIGRRMRHLSEGCVHVLTLASVLGREFDLAPLQSMSGLTLTSLLEILEEAERSRVVAEVPGVLGRMRFAHALIRDAFYEELPVAGRMRLHRLAGESIEAICAGSQEAHLAELAHHFIAAAPGGEVARAIGYARAAGDRGVRLLAFEEAARLYRMALRALELQRPPDPRQRYDLLMALGDAEMRANQVAAGAATFLGALEVARGLSSAEPFARAALGHSGRFVWIRGASNPRIVPLLREALAMMPRRDSELRARLLARLAGALRDAARGEERDALSREAVGVARRVDDRAALAYALDGRFAATWEPGNAHERLGIARELTQMAEEIGDHERALQGHHYQLICLLELGEMPAAYGALQAKSRIAEALRQPAQRWYVIVVGATFALFEGRFRDGEMLMDQALAVCPDGWHAIGSYRSQLFMLRREQGRLPEVEEVIRRSVDEFPVFPVFRAMLALLHVELGREGEARRMLEEAAVRDFGDLPWDCEWLHATSLLAEVACALGDVPRAATLYRLIEPYGHYNVVAPAEVMTGSASRTLGLLATALSRWDDADRHFREAIAGNDTMGARPWAARARVEHASMLLARRRPGDREEAGALLREALACCRDLGMPVVEGKASALLSEVEARKVPGSVEKAGDTRPRLQFHSLRREGEVWTIRYEGGTFRLKDMKGLRYLAHLLAAPCREIHALDLVVADGAAAGRTTQRGDLGDAGTILDGRAKAEYRKRLDELVDLAEDARARGDVAAAAAAEQERDFLIRELAGALGLGGRDRRAGSAGERARVNVTRAIKSALRKLEQHSPSLGRHLASTVRTGTFCSYTPDPRVAVQWEL